MIKKIFLTIAIVVLSLASYSQTAVQQAEKAFAAGEYSDAVQLYEVAASTMLGNDTERQKLYDAANKCRDIAAIQTKAENAYKTKNYKTAIGYYDQILKYNPNDPISKTRKNECVYSIRNAEEIAAWKTVADCQNFADKVANAQKYLNKYPTGRYKQEATEIIEEEVLWQKAVTAKTYDAVSTKQNAEEIAANSQKTSGNNNVASRKINGHEYVDLGLSVKWAACNVGATSPEEYGNYYAWGETTTKAKYNESNCPNYGLSISQLQSQGYIDSEGNLTAQHDAATANWGGSWRMPTKSEMQELIDKCIWTWTTQNGVNGYKVKGPNGNSIFLPAAGYRIGSSLFDAGSKSSCWSSSPNESDSDRAYYLYFYSSYHDMYYYNRDNGQSVRPVIE